MSSGRYITLEGAEGCGKSTHAARLATALDAVLTRETGGTAIGQRIRTILHDTAITNLSHRAEALLAAADRAQHIDEVVAPALTAGRHVVSDRSVYSTLASTSGPWALIGQTSFCSSTPTRKFSNGACAAASWTASSKRATGFTVGSATAFDTWRKVSRSDGSSSTGQSRWMALLARFGAP